MAKRIVSAAEVVRDAERDLPQKRLLGQEVDGPLRGPIDVAADPRCSVIVDIVPEGGHRTLATPTYKIDVALRAKSN